MDWRKIRNEYLNGGISYRKLAEKHNIPYNTLKDRAIREGWFATREERRHKIEAKTEQKVIETLATKEADRVLRILAASDGLLSKLEEATTQLDTRVVVNKTRVKITTKTKRGFREDLPEVSEAATVKGTIDRRGISALSAALKNLKDVTVSLDSGADAEGVQIVDDYR